MSGSSTVAGYLKPTSVEPTEAANLDKLFTSLIVGCTTIPGQYVRPRWQSEPIVQPAPSINWVAMGIIDRRGIDFPYQALENDNVYRLYRYGILTVLLSFYGPDAAGQAEIMRDGAFVPQNLDVLSAANIKLLGASDISVVPELDNNQFIGRADITLTFSRMTEREYNIVSLTSVSGTETEEFGTTENFSAS